MKKIKWISLKKTGGAELVLRIMSGFLTLLLCFGILVMPQKAQAQTDPDGSSYDQRFISSSEVSLTDWMMRIPDEALITEINIPGTHDSGTCYMSDFYTVPWANCVNEDIAGQLKNGNRVFDIRVSGKLGHEEWYNMAIVHNFFNCERADGKYLMLYNVIRDCEQFLTDHHNETIILYLASDGDDEDKIPARKRLAEMRRDCDYRKGGFQLHNEYNVPLLYYCSGDPIPTMKQVRGKIVVIDDESNLNDATDKRRGAGSSYEMHYDEDNAVLRRGVFESVLLGPLGIAIARELYWNSVLNIKYDYLSKFMLDSQNQRQEYTSGHGSQPGVFVKENYSNKKGSYGEPGFKYSGTNVNTFGNLYPLSPIIKEYSAPINEWLNKQWWKQGGRYGWVTMDHPTESVIRKIIATNEVKTTEVQVDINHYRYEPHDIAEHILIGGKNYRGNSKSSQFVTYLTLFPEIAEQLEEGSLDIEIDSNCSIWAGATPVTVELTHLSENHWRCDIYPEIKVTLKWDYAEPPAIDVLKNKFLTAHYADGTECVINAEDVRIEKNTADETILQLHVLPADSKHGEINIDIDPTGGATDYRYDQKEDKQKEGLLSWNFTLHNGGECVNLEGKVIFDDNNNQAGKRGAQYPIRLIATGTKIDPGTGQTVTEPMIFEENLLFDTKNPNWQRKYLPVKYGEYDLTWDLSDELYNRGTGWSSYIITHVKNGTQFTSTFTLHPLSDIRIEWVGDEADTSYRPSSLEIHIHQKSTGLSLCSPVKVYASKGWVAHPTLSFNNGNQDDWDAQIWNLPATYKCEGPIISADKKSVKFVCTRQNIAAIKSNVYWYDGETRAVNHPTVEIALSNGIETVTTRTAGGNTRIKDTIDFGLRDSLDEKGNPYYYSVNVKDDVPSGYIAVISGFEISFIKTGTVSGYFSWYDSASKSGIERPSWIKKDSLLVTLLEKAPGDPEWTINGTEPTIDLVSDKQGKFNFGTIPFGIISNNDPELRMDYHLAVDVSKIPGAASATISKPVPIGGNVFRCSGTVKIVMEPATALVPFTISVEDEGYHPEKAFTVVLKDAGGEVVATQECTVEKNDGTASFQLEFEKKKLEDEDYKIYIQPVVSDDRWTVDKEGKSLTLSVDYNEEKDAIEATLNGDEPVFHVSYKHVYQPITVEVKFPVKAINISLLSAAPAETFQFIPYVNGTKGDPQFLKDGEAITLSANVTAPGEVTFNVDQIPSNNMLWIFDKTERALRVKVSVDPVDGTLVPDYVDGRENTFENIYLGDKVDIVGLVRWREQIDDQDVDATSMRPETVTLELTPFYTPETLAAAGMDESDVEILDTLTVPVTKDSSQSFDFGAKTRFDQDGNLHFYTVREKPIPYYTTTERQEGYSILNELTGEVMHAAGTVEWLGETDESFRPNEVTVNLFRQYKGAEAKKINTTTVKPDTENIWSFDFGAYPVKDTEGNEITYSVEEEPVAGYTTQVNGFTVENTKLFYLITDGDGQSYTLRSGKDATFICDGPFEKFVYVTVDDQKVDPSNYTVAASPTVLTLNSNWLDGLTVAGHSICFCYSDGISNEGTFTILPAITLTKIEITTPPTRTVYTASETFDPTGMVVTATYSDGSSKPVTVYTFSPDGALVTTDTAVTVSYTEGSETRTATQAITVNPPEPVAYKIIIGANQTIYTDAYSALFASDADFSKFDHVEVDGKTVANKYYTAESGSTVIIFNQDYIKALRTGKHKLTIVSKDGRASANFMVKAPLPPTGDNTDPALLMMLLLASVGTILLISARTKKRNER